MRAQKLNLLILSSALCASAAQAEELQIEPLKLQAALVQDPELQPLDEKLIEDALKRASEAFAKRFSVPPPTFEVVNHFTVTGFLGAYSLPVDPRCKPLYEARYRGGGAKELERHKAEAMQFLERWPLDALKGFIEAKGRASIKSHKDVYRYYVERYTQTVDAMKDLKTPKGTPLVSPGRSAKRSFVAWTCALSRQADYDVILTNAFMLADLTTEPHPHAVFGKAKIGGIAAQSPARAPLGGQALLATTFGIDTKLPQFAELPGAPPTFEERSQILGVYLLAHEIAHAVFGIPDVFDHPKGCLMTSRPGASYREGLEELKAHPAPCPKCRPYVEARAYLDQGKMALKANQPDRAVRLLIRSMKRMPQHYHGGRRRRVSQLLVYLSRAYQAQGKTANAKKYAKMALKLDPGSQLAGQHQSELEAQQSLTQLASRNQKMAITVSKTATAATSTTAP